MSTGRKICARVTALARVTAQARRGPERLVTPEGMQTAMSRDTSVYEGDMPTREGEISLEMHGMAPIPADNRYGGLHRIFTVWFTPNLVPAAFFVGALAPVLGLGFGFGLAAILLGTILGALLVSVTGTLRDPAGA
jgi:nucleobase:cation symporter-1, NCS1 family